MTQQESTEVEIFLGRRDCFSSGKPFIPYHLQKELKPVWENTHSLMINGNFISSGKCSGKDDVWLKNAANEYALLMKEHNHSAYFISNGYRLRFTNHEREEVEGLSNREIAVFKETLEAKLKQET